MGKFVRVLGASALALTAVLATAGPAAAVPDDDPPILNMAPSLKFNVGTLLSDRTANPTVSTTVSWTQYDPSGICSKYAYVYWYDSGYYSKYVPLTATQTSFTLNARAGESYEVDITAQDCAGNSGNSYNYYYTRSPIQEGSAKLSPGWTTGNCLCWSGGADVWAKKAGAKASYTFSGSSVAFVSAQAPDRGTATIFIDGVRHATVNLQRSARKNMIIAAQKTFPSYGTHTIDVVVAGTAGHPRVDVDAFLVN